MGLREIRIDGRTWAAANVRRRTEWRLAIAAVLAEQDGIDTSAESLGVELERTCTRLRLCGPDGAELVVHELPGRTLRPHLTEYAEVVRQLGDAEDACARPRIEALDVAKRVVHDAGARAVQRACTGTSMSHEVARRLFTLLFLVRVDSSALQGVFIPKQVR